MIPRTKPVKLRFPEVLIIYILCIMYKYITSHISVAFSIVQKFFIFFHFAFQSLAVWKHVILSIHILSTSVTRMFVDFYVRITFFLWCNNFNTL